MEIIVSITNGVCELKMNRPEVFNSFNKSMALALQKALDDCVDNDEVRAVVITGEGKAFCAGQDLAEATDPNGPELQSIVRDHYNPIIKKIREIEKPVIAAVNGVAAGAEQISPWLVILPSRRKVQVSFKRFQKLVSFPIQEEPSFYRELSECKKLWR